MVQLAIRCQQRVPVSADEFEQWLEHQVNDLRAAAPQSPSGRLHALLLRAARCEIARRRANADGDSGDDLAVQAADDALVAIMSKLHTYRGRSRFTNGRTSSPSSRLIEALRGAIAHVLTPQQRAVLVAVALNDVPIDVLGERRATSRGALYKALHDARRKLRAELAKDGLSSAPSPERPRWRPIGPEWVATRGEIGAHTHGQEPAHGARCGCT